MVKWTRNHRVARVALVLASIAAVLVGAGAGTRW
jgi:hypothetical protein